MNANWLMINQLDKQLKEWRAVSKKYSKPRVGWVKTVRMALSMSVEQLANRLGVTRSRITQLENAEIHDAVTLRSLQEAANAMECELVYAIVPKNNSSLEDIIKKRVAQIANERVDRIAHSMALEAQSVDADVLKNQKNELAKSLTEHLNKKIWAPSDKLSSLAEAIYQQIQKNNEIPTKKGWRNIFFNKLNDCLLQMKRDSKIDLDLMGELENPEFINALKNALIQYHLKNKKQADQTDLLKKLIETLQKKK